MIHLNYIIIIHIQIILTQTGILDELLHTFKNLRPDGIVQTFSLCTFRVTVGGQDLLSYSQDVDIHLTEYLKDVKSVIEENHMYNRICLISSAAMKAVGIRLF